MKQVPVNMTRISSTFSYTCMGRQICFNQENAQYIEVILHTDVLLHTRGENTKEV